MRRRYMGSKLTEVFKQRQIGTLLGLGKIIISNISPYASWVSLVLIGVTSFYTTIGPLFREWGIPLPFWLFCVIIVLFLVGVSLLEWVFMLPSYYKASNVQSWDAGGPFRDKLEEMEKKMDKELTEIKKTLKEIQNGNKQ